MKNVTPTRNYSLREQLKQLRKKRGITQQGLVDGIVDSSMLPPSFNVITYGRWERGVVPLPFKKAIIIIRWLQEDITNFYASAITNLHLLNGLSEQQKNKFEKLLDKLEETGERFVAYSHFTELEPLEYSYVDGERNYSDYFGVEYINRINRRILGVTEDAYLKWGTHCENTISTNSLLLTINNNELLSHMSYTICNHDKLVKFFHLFPSSKLPVNCRKSNFLVVNSFKPSYKKWNEQAIVLLTKEIIANPMISKIYFNLNSYEYTQLLIGSFNGRIVGVRRNPSYHTIITYIVEIESYNFLANHKVMMLYKKIILK